MKKLFTVLCAGFLASSVLMGSAALAKNNEQAGAVVGAIVGGVIGNQVGGGSGKDIATGLGIIAGAMIGSSMGKVMDEHDRHLMASTQKDGLEYVRINSPCSWQGQSYYGNFYVLRTGYYSHYECRSYRNEIYGYNGYREIRSGTTCYSSRGWTEVNESVVIWN